MLSKVFILGEEIVAGDDLYGGSDRLLSQVVPKTGAVVKLVHSLVRERCSVILCSFLTLDMHDVAFLW